jgi:hypothetical protein
VVATSKYACVLYDAVADNNEKVVFLTQFYIELISRLIINASALKD